ncbi:hypothetical protein SAMN04487947_1095 [Halogeometricum rufum]|jgi:hypothetical protein|uniref:DUF7315 domain-containing protein n=1 Tax=Halogeometricum rufum TaxID=553469 RepID=A0A1I6GFW4_9EURY|nr:hypothetical protein [Halogeometricum rufum]SFR41103.1 hypothetical protein SAMN04487947_1095 [Halogeometricum rufum]
MTDGDGTTGAESTQRDGTERGRRDVVVPMRLYKTVTVFSTLIAVVSVVFGFMLLDAATLNVSFLGSIVTGGLSVLGVSVADGVVSTALAIVGLAVIGFGAGVYTLGTRFRARGMGKSQEDSDEDSE